jgi:hypothetical protein
MLLGGASPSKGNRNLNSTMGGASPSRKRSKAGRSKSPKKGQSAAQASSGHTAQKSKKEEEKGLTSPTSISMASSFIIKNADQSFDAYFHQMRRRKQNGDQSFNQSMTIGAQTKFGVVRGKAPTARDGHSSVIDKDGYMFIFGGDRHHMPFNDLYMINLS